MIIEHTASTTSRSLFDIGEDMIQLEKFIESLDGDISDPAVEEKVVAWLNGLGAEQGKKIDNYINLMRKWESEAAAAQAEIDCYQRAKKVRDARVERFKSRLKMHMEATNQTKIETASGRTVAIRNNGGKQPLHVSDVDPTKLDPAYQKITVSLNTDAIYRDLTAGKTLPFASLAPRGSHLRIS